MGHRRRTPSRIVGKNARTCQGRLSTLSCRARRWIMWRKSCFPAPLKLRKRHGVHPRIPAPLCIGCIVRTHRILLHRDAEASACGAVEVIPAHGTASIPRFVRHFVLDPSRGRSHRIILHATPRLQASACDAVESTPAPEFVSRNSPRVNKRQLHASTEVSTQCHNDSCGTHAHPPCRPIRRDRTVLETGDCQGRLSCSGFAAREKTKTPPAWASAVQFLAPKNFRPLPPVMREDELGTTPKTIICG